MYQNQYFNQNQHCNLRSILDFKGYSEGWATYVEHYAYTLENNGLEKGVGELLHHNAPLLWLFTPFWISASTMRAGIWSR